MEKSVQYSVPKGKRPLGCPRKRWEDQVKSDVDKVAIDREKWSKLCLII